MLKFFGRTSGLMGALVALFAVIGVAIFAGGHSTARAGTGFPVAISTVRGGKPDIDIKLSTFVPNPPLTIGDFAPVLPKGARVHTTDNGVQSVSLDEAAKLAGRATIAPTNVPDSFRLAQVLYAADVQYGGYRSADIYNKKVVSLTYRSGLASFTISTRPTGSDKSVWYVNPDGMSDALDVDQRITLNAGHFTGDQLRFTATATQGDSWVVGSDLVLAVTGDLTRGEMQTLAESM